MEGTPVMTECDHIGIVGTLYLTMKLH